MDSQPPIPRSTILSYVASLESPTRVRIVASKTLRIAGWLLMALALISLVFAILDFLAFARTSLMYFPSITSGPVAYTPYSGYSPTHTSTPDMLIDHFLRNPLPLMAFVFCFLTGIMFATTSGPILRGRKLACAFAIPAILLHLLLYFFLTLLGSCAVSISILDSFRDLTVFACALPLTTLMLLLTLLAKDLIAILLWIFRNPLTEKNSVPFL